MTEGSSSGPCKTHGDVWHARCRAHECCIGQQGRECRALGAAPLAACQCDVLPERPCPAPITQEDLLCDSCRAARKPGMIHASMSFTGSIVRTSHIAIFEGVFAPEESRMAPGRQLSVHFWTDR